MDSYSGNDGLTGVCHHFCLQVKGCHMHIGFCRVGGRLLSFSSYSQTCRTSKFAAGNWNRHDSNFSRVTPLCNSGSHNYQCPNRRPVLPCLLLLLTFLLRHGLKILLGHAGPTNHMSAVYKPLPWERAYPQIHLCLISHFISYNHFHIQNARS